MEHLSPYPETLSKNSRIVIRKQDKERNHGEAMGSPIGLVLTGIFMAELETRIIPTVTDNISHWRRYVDDTFVFIKKGYVCKTCFSAFEFFP